MLLFFFNYFLRLALTHEDGIYNKTTTTTTTNVSVVQRCTFPLTLFSLTLALALSLSLSLSLASFTFKSFSKRALEKKKKEKGWVELFFSRYTHVQRLLKKHEPTFFFFLSLSLSFLACRFQIYEPPRLCTRRITFLFFFLCVCVCTHDDLLFFFWRWFRRLDSRALLFFFF